MRVLKIETNGKMEMVDITGTIEQKNDQIYSILGGYFDIVRMWRDAAILVDDEGLLKELPANRAAMMISGYPILVGTALLVGLKMTDDGEIFASCPERFEKYVKESA